MQLRITDNLPDLSKRVYKEEVRLLASIAGLFLTGLTEQEERDIVATKEVRPHESCPVCESVDDPPG